MAQKMAWSSRVIWSAMSVAESASKSLAPGASLGTSSSASSEHTDSMPSYGYSYDALTLCATHELLQLDDDADAVAGSETLCACT